MIVTSATTVSIDSFTTSGGDGKTNVLGGSWGADAYSTFTCTGDGYATIVAQQSIAMVCLCARPERVFIESIEI